MKWFVMFGFALCTFTLSLHAQSKPPVHSANELVTECTIAVALNTATSANDGPRWFQGGFCFGFITGFADANSLLASSLFCPPPGVTVGQMAKVFLKYMDEHPEDLHRYASPMLATALRKAFSCPGSEK